jgi:hypothetical protein
MRSHSSIIRDAGRSKVAAALPAPIHTVNSWVQRDSIPVQHWQSFVQNNWSTLAELLDYAEKRKAA